jgi:hypothetical protein
MDRERAETFLRGFAETQLRRAPLDSWSWARWRVRTVGDTLVRVGALDAEVAEAIDDDIELALVVREPRRGGPRLRPRGPRTKGGVTRHFATTSVMTAHVRSGPAQSRVSGAVAGGPPRQPRSAPERIVPLDLRIPMGAGQDRCVVHLLAFFGSGTDACFPVHIRLTDPTPDPGHTRRFSTAFRLANAMSMTDETGASYLLRFSGGGNPQDGLHGQLDIEPNPPPGTGWFEITPQDGTPVRVNLTGAGPAPAVTVTPVTRAPGESLLHAYAARLLSQSTLPLVDVLGDLVAALRAVDALPPHSPVPGQLARLCERQGARGHGIGAEPARDEDLPEQWRAPGYRQAPAPHPRNCFATATVALPELDGARMTIIGLANSTTTTTLYAHVSGVLLDHRNGILPALWLHDEHGNWHTTSLGTWSSSQGESEIQMAVWPPLNRASAIDILACGQSAEVRTTLPLIWR